MDNNLITLLLCRLHRISGYGEIKNKDALNIEDVAFLTGMSKSTIYKLTCANKIPHYKLCGKRVYFVKSEIEEWMKQGYIPVKQE